MTEAQAESINIEVLYFAGLREHTGKHSESFSFPNPCSSNDVLSVISNAYPHLQNLCDRSRVAIDQSFIHEAVAISNSSEIAVIPPVSGG
ncbi:MAG: MoaD/ThiS family protein [Planctomycetes bacterium]|nr:MoaD/ThiS family protein [Planctomycetota bacterium]